MTDEQWRALIGFLIMDLREQEQVDSQSPSRPGDDGRFNQGAAYALRDVIMDLEDILHDPEKQLEDLRGCFDPTADNYYKKHMRA
jgi:hypothetical protein